MLAHTQVSVPARISLADSPLHERGAGAHHQGPQPGHAGPPAPAGTLGAAAGPGGGAGEWAADSVRAVGLRLAVVSAAGVPSRRADQGPRAATGRPGHG